MTSIVSSNSTPYEKAPIKVSARHVSYIGTKYEWDGSTYTWEEMDDVNLDIIKENITSFLMFSNTTNEYARNKLAGKVNYVIGSLLCPTHTDRGVKYIPYTPFVEKLPPWWSFRDENGTQHTVALGATAPVSGILGMMVTFKCCDIPNM